MTDTKPLARDPDKLRRKLIDFFAGFAFYQHMGMQLLDLGPGWAHVTMNVAPVLLNPNGVLHGGALSTLIDTAITQTMLMTEEFQLLRDQKQGYITTIDLRVKFLRPVKPGTIRCEARIHHMGRQVFHAMAVVTDEAGRELAQGDASYMIVRG